MTKAQSIQQRAPKASREGRKNSKSAAAPADACELFLAELQVRRRRLRQLLALVQMEADRMNAARSALPARRRCTRARGTTAA